ncbi:cell wall-binding repeat-containing protein [Clostridioides sp. GD02377]|uniref:cell wall-binding repeat-containing protein n=1 Tax=unclassified Clostridioides TaxID=2635829 RepID=UPI0038A1E6B0
MNILSKKAFVLSLSLVVASPLVYNINAQGIEKNMEVRNEARKINNLENMAMKEVFPDEKFRDAIRDTISVLKNKTDANIIGLDGVAAIESQIELDVAGKNINSLEGIEYFKALKNLNCEDNKIKSLNISQNINLTGLSCNKNSLETLDVSNNPNLIELNCKSNSLNSLNVNKNEKLEDLYISNNKIETLDTSKNKSLTRIDCERNSLKTLDLKENINLEELNCQNNSIVDLDFSHNVKLKKVDCRNNSIKNIIVSKSIDLESLNCMNNKIERLDISKNIKLKDLNCLMNELHSLDVTNNINLIELGCENNKIEKLDVGKNPNLEVLNCSINKLDALDVKKNTKLKTLFCSTNNLKNIDISENKVLEIFGCAINNLEKIDLHNNINLKNLYCSTNNLKTIDTSKNIKLERLYCNNNNIQSLNLSNNVNLDELDCSNQKINKDIGLKDSKLFLDLSKLNDIDINKILNVKSSGTYEKNTGCIIWNYPNNINGQVATYDYDLSYKGSNIDISNTRLTPSITLISEFDSQNKPSGGGSHSSTTPTPAKPSNTKLVGSDRNETSVKISQKGWNKADNIVLINDSSISDALSATPFAKSKDAPILLTKNNNLNKLTEKEINRLEAKNVYIVGGLKSVDEKVVSDLKEKGLNVIRIFGNDRYETSIKLAKELDKNSKLSKVVVVNGEKGLADAVSMGAISAKEEMPILLTNQNDDMKDIKDLIDDKDISKSYVIGGESLFNSKEVSNTLPSVTKIAGSDRTETNSKVINHFYSKDTLNDLYIAKNGMNKQDDLVDALSVGVLAGKTESPVVLVGNGLDNSQKELIKNKKFKNITQIGGNGNEKAFSEVENLVK